VKIAAIVQARMQSTRLPGKVLSEIHGQPMLQRVVQRVQKAELLDEVIVATSAHVSDDPIADFCRQRNIPHFRGNRHDVLDRYLQAAKHYALSTIVRLTADCPLLDPGVIDRIVGTFNADRYDYCSNTIECTYPDGLDTEVFSFAALEKAWQQASLLSQREHVTRYIVENPERFRLINVSAPEDHSALRWTVDEPQDLEFVRRIYSAIDRDQFSMQEVLDVLMANPDLHDINKDFLRNEGYYQTLQNDRVVQATELQ
jgi:spore coat polysaccharide biosynthesis protein SpsF (cytidylyltransferase family)